MVRGIYKRKKMNFEEEFPSLKGLLITFEGNFGDLIGEGYEKEDIQKHCLDKQRVKEAVNKHLKDMMILSVNRKSIIDFMEELGLK